MLHYALLASFLGFLAISTLPASADSTPINIVYDIAHVGGYTSDPNTPTYGWTYPHAGMGTAVVTPISADLKSDPTNGEVGALFLDTGLNVQAPSVSLSFDIDAISQAATGYDQSKLLEGTNASVPILFGVRIFGGGAWAASFQLAPTSDTTGLFGFRSPDNASLTTFGNYDTNTLYHVKIDVDYLNNSASAYINGNLAISNFALGGGANSNATTSEIFTYLNGAPGSANEVLISATTPLPSSAWMGLGVLGILGTGRILGRRKAAL